MSTVQATNLKHGSSVSNNIVLDASGNTTISGAATISGNAVVTGTLQANGVTGSVYPLVQGTAVASTSGTSIDFTGIPSWARRVTVMFNGVSTNGTNRWLIQLGAGAVATSGYNSVGGQIYFGSAFTDLVTSTAGFIVGNNLAANLVYGSYTFTNFSGNTWVGSHAMGATTGVVYSLTGGGSLALAGALDRIRITTVGGTDTFDAGSINLLWE